jgi:hypothetical protein
LARFCSARGIEPGNVDDGVFERFIADVREGSLHPRPSALHRKVATIWNEVVAAEPSLALNDVTVPIVDRGAKRFGMASLPTSFLTDLEAYLGWCAGADVFDAAARDSYCGYSTVRKRGIAV